MRKKKVDTGQVGGDALGNKSSETNKDHHAHPLI